ncbi:hypothetical protein LR48_Vigan11g099500 [Vigna angularis]|uniref:ADP-ribosyl cyclase/cyclic ADP-ribose hydrolase n=1 Tax=Phaseolus angularis TaxID=3914 RepID=A0A0L9VSZ6_PHAAN|nr:hypothetical protein LR48_Vigan11g099500 [Vigna angularis]
MELASSSSSSSSFLKSKPHFIYDVFIKFWGEDMRRKLVSHLHSVLLQAQLKTFISMENLEEGMQLEEHMRALTCSKIAIIVFSKTYTESTCGLRELVKIIECGQTFDQIVLPVFYEIDRFYVRHQIDGLRKALEEAAHKSYSGEQPKHVLSRWSRALTRSADLGITEWNNTYSRHDAALVEKIVSRVQKLLGYADLSHTPFPVGLESHVEKGGSSIGSSCNFFKWCVKEKVDEKDCTMVRRISQLENSVKDLQKMMKILVVALCVYCGVPCSGSV